MFEILLDITLPERGTYCNFCFASFPKTMLAISIAHSFIAFLAMVWVFLFLAISYATLWKVSRRGLSANTRTNLIF